MSVDVKLIVSSPKRKFLIHYVPPIIHLICYYFSNIMFNILLLPNLIFNTISICVCIKTYTYYLCTMYLPDFTSNNRFSLCPMNQLLPSIIDCNIVS